MEIETAEWVVVVAILVAVMPIMIIMWLALYDELRDRW